METDPTAVAPDVEAMLYQLFAVARELQQASISVERLLAAVLQMPPVMSYLDDHLGSESAALCAELDSMLARETAAREASGGLRGFLRRLAALGRGRRAAPQASPEFHTVLSKAFLRTLSKKALTSTDILLSVIENSQEPVRGLLERHRVTRHSLVCYLVRGSHAGRHSASVDLPRASGDVRVVLLDDDFTPQPFVVEVLESVFGMTRDEATALMMTVHDQGRAVCGLFPARIAQAKMDEIEALAVAQQHPLRCILELP